MSPLTCAAEPSRRPHHTALPHTAPRRTAAPHTALRHTARRRRPVAVLTALLGALVLSLAGLALPGSAGIAAATPSGPALALDPATDLLGGDVVAVHGTGFKANTRLLVMQTVALPRTGLPVSYTGRQQVTTDRSGQFTAQIIVRQSFGRINCVTARCTIAAVAAPPAGTLDRSQDAVAPLSFRDGTGPTLVVAPHEALREGSEVMVTGSGFVRGSKLQLAQTVARPDDGRPGAHREPIPVTADARGRFVATVAVSPKIGTVNCLQTECYLAAYPTDPGATDKDNDAWTPIDFDPSDGTTLTLDREAIDQFETAQITLTGAQPLDKYSIAVDGPAPFSVQPIVAADRDGQAAVLLMADVHQAVGEYTAKLTTERTGNVTEIAFNVGPSPLFSPAEKAPGAQSPLGENYGEGFGQGESSAEAAARAAGDTVEKKNRWYLIPLSILAVLGLLAVGWFARDPKPASGR